MNNAKWQSWKQLGDMPKAEAMRLFVRTLEEEVPNWWSPDLESELERQGQLDKDGSEQDDGDEKGEKTGTLKTRSVAEVVVEGSWVSPYIADDSRPPPRYEHSTALLGNLLFLVGGNYAGRYMSDTWCMDLENLTWSFVCGKRKQGGSSETDGVDFPASAGHAAVSWNGQVILLGGHRRTDRSKGKVKVFEKLSVLSLDPVRKSWHSLETGVEEGLEQGPQQRGGHTATLIGSKVYLFGGEDPYRRALDDLWVLDLTTMIWEQPTGQGNSPQPRSSHTAVCHQGRYILIFGGGSIANCFNDLAVLDTQTMTWIRPEMIGPVPPVRAGHASAVLGSVMYVVGGGNNAKGCADMYALDLSNVGTDKPLQWTLVGNTPPESAIASEGLSLICVPMAGCLLSFGGYNGKYHNAIHVYRPEDYVVVKPHQAASKSNEAQEANGDPSSSRANSAAVSELEASRREAAIAKEATALELSIMRQQLDSATEALTKAEKLAEAAREALAEEEQKTMHLQVEVAELRKKLAGMADLEKELARYREETSKSKENNTGIWGYITGSDAATK